MRDERATAIYWTQLANNGRNREYRDEAEEVDDRTWFVCFTSRRQKVRYDSKRSIPRLQQNRITHISYHIAMEKNYLIAKEGKWNQETSNNFSSPKHRKQADDSDEKKGVRVNRW